MFIYSKGVALLELPPYIVYEMGTDTHNQVVTHPLQLPDFALNQTSTEILSQHQDLPPSMTLKKKNRAVSYIYEWWQNYYCAGRVLEGITKEGAPQTGKDGYNYKLGQEAPGAGPMSTPPPCPRSPTLSSQNIYPSFFDCFDRMEVSLKLFQS